MSVSIRCAVIAGIFVLVGCSSSGAALAIDLEKGDSRDPVSRQFQDGAVASALLAAQFYGMSGFVTLDEGSSYYALLGTALVQYEMNARKVIGSWPLTRWQHQYDSPEMHSYRASVFGEEEASAKYDSVHAGIGCLGLSPLRYGELNAGGDKEIVLLLGENLILFSPTFQRVIFAEDYDFGDSVSAEKTLEDREEGINVEENAQYGSVTWYSAAREGVLMKGIRGYAKIYFGDFDQDGHPDILAWRKTYKSNLVGGAPGFSLINQRFQHFERNLDAQSSSNSGVIGEYLPQQTEPDVVQSWLVANTLTWSQGFPSQSECPGEEGQLIPEMHDPLLNDPDVLQ